MMNKLFKKYFLLFFIIVFCISTGYAYLNSSLYINGTSIISANVWDVGLDNLNVTAGSVVAIKEPTLDNTTTTSFEVKLENKEDFYEFTVDVVNRGEHDAKLGSLVETTGLTQEQEQYFEHTVTYQNNEPIQVNQLVKKDEFVRLKSKVEYKEDVEITQVPESAKTLKLDIKMNYDLDDGNGVSIKDNGVYYSAKIISGDYDTVGSEIVIGNEHFYVISSDEDSVTMFAKLNISTDSIPKQSSSAEKVRFSKDGYWKSDTYPSYVYDSNSILYNYVESYKTYLESYRASIEEIRIIKMEELEALGCSNDSSYCYNAPEWVSSTEYWTGTAILDGMLKIVRNNGVFMGGLYDDFFLGIRPVIVLPKSEIVVSERQLIEFTIDGTIFQAEEGMTWGEWIDSEYSRYENYTIVNSDIYITVKVYNPVTDYTSMFGIYYDKYGDDEVHPSDVISNNEYYFG